jgi:hypothetical protein
MGLLLTVSGFLQFASLVKRYGQAWLILERHQKPGARLMLELQLEMGQKFPELRLCEGNWKADLIATLNYPPWYSNNIEKEGLKRVSAEPLPTAKRSKSIQEVPGPAHKKRQRQTGTQRAANSCYRAHCGKLVPTIATTFTNNFKASVANAPATNPAPQAEEHHPAEVDGEPMIQPSVPATAVPPESVNVNQPALDGARPKSRVSLPWSLVILFTNAILLGSESSRSS